MMDTGMHASFGYWVRRCRKALDLTQQALADQVGCSLVMVKKIEADERQPSHQMAERLASVLHIPLERQAAFLALARGRLPSTSSEPLLSLHHIGELGFPQPSSANLVPFFGREAEQQEIATRLNHQECRLLTLIGPGGIGKTRLAMRFAEIAPFAQSACVIRLEDIRTPLLVVPTMARALGVEVTGSEEMQEALIRFLRNGELLLVLDNVEQLLPGSAPEPNAFITLLLHILHTCRKVKILVTSRELLGIQSEWLYPLSGLAVEDGASQLFEDRARRRDPSFSSVGKLATIEAICSLVEGMPLAIELAAGWIPTLSCEQIRARLQTDTDLLTTHLRDVPARHRSLHALLDHSWDLWTQPEREGLMKLSVFRGSFPSKICAQVTGIGEEGLRILVEKSVISVEKEGRYRLHELTRRYLADRLAATGTQSRVRHDHFLAYLAFTESAASRLPGPSALLFLNQLDDESENLREALDWALLHADQSIPFRLAVPLARYWYARGQWQEGIMRLQAVLERTAGVNVAERAICLCWCGFMLIRSGKSEVAQPYITEGHTLASQLQDERALGWAWLAQSYFTHEEAEMVRSCQTALEHFRQADDNEGCAMALYFLGDILRQLWDVQAARQAYSESWQIYHRLGNRIWGAYPLGNLGRLALLEGDLASAEQRFRACVAYSRDNGNRISLVDWLIRLGTIALYRADQAAARVALLEAETLAQHIGYQDALPTLQMWLALQKSLDSQEVQAQDILSQSKSGSVGYRFREALTPFDPQLPHHRSELVEALIAVAHIATRGSRYNRAIIALGCVSRLMKERGGWKDQPLFTMIGRLLSISQGAVETTTYKKLWEEGEVASGEPIQLLMTCLRNIAR